MDIEFSEWPALYDILQSGLANKIRQIAIEFHTPEMDIHIRPNHKCTWSKHETLATMMKILFDLRNSGFSTYYTRTNYRTAFESPFTRRERYCCHNLHMVNTKHPLNGWKPPPKMLRRGHHWTFSWWIYYKEIYLYKKYFCDLYHFSKLKSLK